jgi:hypothetical protein
MFLGRSPVKRKVSILSPKRKRRGQGYVLIGGFWPECGTVKISKFDSLFKARSNDKSSSPPAQHMRG